ncbi:MAG: hypothetical protein EHM28_00855 [Spirochaetaceae bacterium]|nr:MAG: hypothetical protein EHM28_00855 [Spirochaetaceae bacterium]
MLGKKSVPFITTFLLSYLVFQTLLQLTGIKTYPIPIGVDKSVSIGLLITGSALITYVIMGNYDSMISNIRGQAMDLKNELDARQAVESALRDSETRYRPCSTCALMPLTRSRPCARTARNRVVLFQSALTGSSPTLSSGSITPNAGTYPTGASVCRMTAWG